MPNFNYIAVDRTGKEVRGKMFANNSFDLETRIKELTFELVDYKLVKEKKAGLRSKISEKDMIMFCVHMEELDNAGVPILDSIVDMRDTVDSAYMRDLMADLAEYIKAGEQLSSALSKRRDVFDELFISLIAAGEETGDIGNAFGHLSRHIKWQSEFKRKIKKAISYPIVLMVVMSTVITLMMLFVVPKLVDFLTKQGFDLPIHTRALIATSAFFVEYWWAILLGIPGIIVSIVMLYRKNETVREKMDKMFLKIPGIGPVILKINIARFVKFFAITFNGGMGVIESLETAQKVVINRPLNHSVGSMIYSISEGVRLTDAIAKNEYFPSLVSRMFKIGEDSGNMEKSLTNINFFYEREIDDAVGAMVAMIQPTLLVFMGGTLTWIIAAVFGPVYGSFSKMKF